MSERLILAINPGSTSTKISLYSEEEKVFEVTLRHSAVELSLFDTISDQFNFRKELIMNELINRNTDFDRIAAVVGRGGLLKPLFSGIYAVNDKMKDDLREAVWGEHASNLGGLIADEIASSLPSAQAFIVDPVVVDELTPVARISGHPAIERISIFHALNQKAVARLYAGSVGDKYENLNLIVAHLGGGISVGAHKKGKVIDVNNALDGEGPFSPERSGGLPAGQLARLCFSGRYTYDEIKAMITGRGGMVAYLGTNNFKEVCERALNGDEKARLVSEAAAYQVAREIGAMAAVLAGKVDAIILTGGMTFQDSFVEQIKTLTGFIARIVVYPGEDEMKALALSGLLALDGSMEIKTYT